MSATAGPPSVPRNHVMAIAGTRSSQGPISSGRPPTMSSTTGRPVAMSAVEKLALPAGEREAGAGGRLAAHRLRLAQHRDDDVGGARRLHRLAEAGIVLALGIAARLVGNADIGGAGALTDALQQGDDLVGPGAGGVRTELIVAARRQARRRWQANASRA